MIIAGSMVINCYRCGAL